MPRILGVVYHRVCNSSILAAAVQKFKMSPGEQISRHEYTLSDREACQLTLAWFINASACFAASKTS